MPINRIVKKWAARLNHSGKIVIRHVTLKETDHTYRYINESGDRLEAEADRYALDCYQVTRKRDAHVFDTENEALDYLVDLARQAVTQAEEKLVAATAKLADIQQQVDRHREKKA